MIFILWGVIIALLIFLVGSIASIKSKEKYQNEKRELQKQAREYDREVETGLNAKKSSTVYEHIDSIKIKQTSFPDNMQKAGHDYFEENMKDLREHAEELEYEEWERKESKVLDDFLYYYTLINEGGFEESDKMLYAKRRCIQLLRKHLDSWEGHNIKIYPRDFMKSYLGDEYDPCMDNTTSLERELDKKIAELRPERIRKTKLMSEITEIVKNENSIMRAKLLKYPFQGYAADEIKYCYKELLEKNKLAEMKIGERYFVMLSDKSQIRNEKQME